MGLETSPLAASMAAWETEDEMSPPLVKPTLAARVESRTPSRGSRTPSHSSRRSRRSVTPPGRISGSPPPMPGSDKTDKSDRVRKDMATDENISILDPRRFTPTLHANLVSEILTLRRDQEDKLKVIETLETTLQSTREEEDTIQNTLQTTAKENRSLKRQLALLEGGTSSALGELARERDEAIEQAAESKRKFEAAQKKLKSHEEDVGRTHDSWAKEKDEWDEERRKMERKIHVAEARLKTVLEEVAAFQIAQANGQSLTDDEAEDRARDSDAGSVRSMSIRESVRFSILNKGPNGHSLADELDFDDDSDYQTDANGRDSVLSNHRHMRTDSRASTRSKTHRRHHSGESLVRPGSVARSRFQSTNNIIQEDEEMHLSHAPVVKSNYTDTGIQYSPPPSPKLPPLKGHHSESSGVSALAARWEKHHEETSTEANQRKKRVSIAKPVTIQPVLPPKQMVSASAQTVDMPLSPPRTPSTPTRPPPPTPKAKPSAMVCAGTQTDAPTPPRPVTPPNTLAIPSIAIHPPTSRPSSPKQPRLPQLFKDFGCQVSLSAVPTSTTGVQTEEIRIDQRLDRLPAHLHPSAITSRPTSPASPTNTSPAPADANYNFTPVPGNVPPPRNPKRLTSQRSLSDIASSPRPSLDQEARDILFDSPSSGQTAAQNSQRINSLFSTFHEASSADEIDDFADADMSDSEYRTALSAPRAVKSPEPGRATPSTTVDSPEQPATRKFSAGRESTKAVETAQTNGFSKASSSGLSRAPSTTKPTLKPSAMVSAKAGGMRKAAMIQNGIATHQEENPRDPPFPIPTRASSRQPLFSRPPSISNRSPTRNEPWHRKGTRTTHRANSLRKSRSAAPVPYGKNKSRRKNSRSPPYTPDMPHTPTIPPLPKNAKDFVTPKNERPRGRGHRHQHSGTTVTTEATQVTQVTQATQATQATEATGTQSNTSSQAASGVVDAIAQTMVGEWMFKYVRRRKSFTMGSDNNKGDDTSNDRHKRWVWLAPYERAILWSSKQPSSGSALLGKSGRKLTIQSVLDVKDDNPPPKGVQTVFNRSILILTPQRALKFTAINAERHYLWLTSLSFLAHSQQDVPDIPPPAPKQVPEFEFATAPPPEPKVRRPRIRDSIRLAKSHNPALNRMSRPTGGLGATMSSQNHGMNNTADRTISPMPSIPNVPMSLIPGYRSPPPPAATESVTSGYSYPSNSSKSKHHERELSIEVAEPPQIPRFSSRDRVAAPAPGVHGRKRSNTGGHVPPPLSFRGFSGGSPNFHHAPTNSQSTGTGSSDYYGARTVDTLSVSGWGAQSTISGRTSEASNRMSGNFFDAIGTVRMEAFISPLAYSRYEGDGQLNYPDPVEERRARARRRSKDMRRKKSRSRSRQRDSFSRGTRGWGRDDYYGGHRTAEEEYTSSRRDPFEGF